MVGEAGEQRRGVTREGVARVGSMPELAELLRWLRRRDARRRGDAEVTYRELAARTGWSRAVIGEYFTGRALPPTDRFDELVGLLGASPVERGVLGTARDRVAERRRAGPGRVGGAEGTAAAGTAADTGTAAVAGVADGRPVPAQLPADVSGFIGRAGQVAELDRLLEADGRTPAVLISVVSGTAGVGKSALAVHWAHRVRDRFADGQLYVNLRGFDPAGAVMDPAEAVRGFLDALEVPSQRIPAGLDAKAALYRSLLSGRRMLVVLDNARDADQVRPLLPGTPGCPVVVTSRNQLSGLLAAGARPLTLDLLSVGEAQQFLVGRLGSDRVATQPQAVRELIVRCARLPLALAIVAARAASHRDFPLATLASELREAGGRLDALTGGDPRSDARAVFSWSYHALGDQAASMFRLLGLHPGPDISTVAAASLTGLPVGRARLLLAELTRANLVAEHVPGRYTFHDLLRVYAVEQANATETDEERRQALLRMLEHYLHTAHSAARLLHSHWEPITLAPPRPGVIPEPIAHRGEAMAWFSAERPVLLAAMDTTVDAGFDAHAWQLAWALNTFLDRRGHWHDLAATEHAALRAARHLADRDGQARAHRALGRAYGQLGRLDDARAHLLHSLDLCLELGEHAGQARTHLGLAWILELRGRYREALGHARQALDLFQTADHRRGRARALNNVGWYHALLSEDREALTYCEQALVMHQELGDRSGEASSWDSLGLANHNLGHSRQAIACYQRAERLFRQLGDRGTEAEVLTRLGDACRAAGDDGPARDAWRQAVAILDDLDHPDAAQVRAKLREPDQRPARPAMRTA